MQSTILLLLEKTCLLKAFGWDFLVLAFLHLLAEGVFGNPGMLPSFGLARLAWKPASLSSVLIAWEVKSGCPNAQFTCGIYWICWIWWWDLFYLITWIHKVDNPLHIPVQGVPQTKAIFSIDELWFNLYLSSLFTCSGTLSTHRTCFDGTLSPPSSSGRLRPTNCTWLSAQHCDARLDFCFDHLSWAMCWTVPSSHLLSHQLRCSSLPHLKIEFRNIKLAKIRRGQGHTDI